MTRTATVPRGTELRRIPLDTELRTIPLDRIDVGDNVRVNIAELEELAASIAEHGVLQPVKAIRMDAGGDRPPAYRLVWGQRRVLASRMAGLTEIPAIVLDGDATSLTEDSTQRSVEQLVENLHRADLNPIDRARAMRAVVDSGVSQAELAKKLGIGASTVANDLGLLLAPGEVQGLVELGQLSLAYAKALKGLPAATQTTLAKRAVSAGLSAHSLEESAKWERQHVAATERKIEASDRAAAAAVAFLAKANLAAGTPIHLTGSYELHLETIADAIRTAGWAIDTAWGRDRKDDPCGCVDVRLEVTPQGVGLVAVCLSNEHDLAREAIRRAERDANEKKRDRELDELRAAFRRGWTAQPPHPLIARLILRGLDNYYGDGWSGYLKLDDDQVLEKIVSKVLAPGWVGAKPMPMAKIARELGL
ncbi:MAG: ParB/RepB/Spo0J family partition protein, partial [Chloroflexota bacterium]